MPPLDEPNTPADYMPTLPRAVREAAERANRLMADMAAPDSTTVVPGDDVSPLSPDTPPAAPVAPDDAPPAPPPIDWEQRYRTLQGKYDVEVPSLNAQVNGMREVLATVSKPPTGAKPEPKAEASLISEADIDAYGPELVESARRWARAELAPEIQRIEQKLAELGGRTTQVAERIDQNNADAYLDGDLVIGRTWRATNNDPGFLAWLNMVDPLSGMNRHHLITEAYSRGDGPRTANFFKAYLSEQTVVGQPRAPAPHTPNGAGSMSLEELAAPGRGTSAPQAPGASSKRMWSGPEIAAFYRDVQKGVYHGREGDKLRTEADILAAPAEGRIRN